MDDAQPEPVPEVLTYQVAPGQGTPEAAFEGHLTVDEDTGYVQATSGDGEQMGVVFPEGTAVTSDGGELELPSGVVIILNRDVVLTGGYSSTPPADAPELDFDEYFLVADDAE